MHRSSVDDWIRFYDEVIVNGGAWAPEAWYAAVGDAMAKALPADSPILDTWRRRVEELLELERAGAAGEEHERRIGALEAEIQRLIGAADEVIRTPRTVPAMRPAPPDLLASKRTRPRRSLFRAVGQTAAALVLIGAGLLGALYVYDAQLALRVDREVERYGGGLRTTVERLNRDLQSQIQANLAERRRLEEARAALRQEVSAFDEKTSEAFVLMRTLQERATADLEARLDDAANPVRATLQQAQRRADGLGRDVERASAEVVALEQAMPAIGERLSRLSSEAAQGESVLTEVMRRLAALERLAPEIERMASTTRARLEDAAGREQQELAELGSLTRELRAAFESSQQQLAGARAAVAEELGRVAEERAKMGRAARGLEGSRRAIASLEEDVARELDQTHQVVRKRADELLADLAERADVAVRRGEGVLDRAEKQLVRELQSAGEEALQAYLDRREKELADLAGNVAATRSELDQTRASLIESWRRMDVEAARRQRSLLADLDGYAAEVEARVEELIAAFDVIAAAEQAAPR